MHEGTRDLDEAFKIKVVFVAAFQPEVLEDIVRFVVVAPVETLEIPSIAGMKKAVVRGLKGLDKACNAIVLRHGLMTYEPEPRERGCVEFSGLGVTIGHLPFFDRIRERGAREAVVRSGVEV